MDCFAALAMTGREHTSAFPRRIRALPTLSPKEEGAGNAGCLLHPRSRVQEMEVEAHTSIQVQPEHSGNRPSLDLIPFVLEGREPVGERGEGVADLLSG
jgi:hypothetical protein